MNNKKLGTEFEREACECLSGLGWWVHFLSPDMRGAQPFDIIAVKNDVPIAIDCKTSATHIFPYSRLEQNQIYAFEKWLKCGNTKAIIMVKYDGHIYTLPYTSLKIAGKADLSTMQYLY